MLKNLRRALFATLLFGCVAHSQDNDLRLRIIGSKVDMPEHYNLFLDEPKHTEPTLEEHLEYEAKRFGINIPKELQWLVTSYGTIIKDYNDLKDWNRNYAYYTFMRRRNLNGRVYVSRVVDWRELNTYNVTVSMEWKVFQ